MLYLAIAALALVGCQSRQSLNAAFDNYLYRLSNSLDVERGEDQSPASLLPYPRRSALLYDVPAFKINILQFMQLSKCDLQRLIGQRNSSLGQWAAGYHSLLYERRFLALARRCRQALVDYNKDKGDPLYDALNQAIAHKEAHRQQLSWNATFAGDEMRHLFSLGSRPLTRQQLSDNPVALISALSYLKLWLSEPTTPTQASTRGTVEETTPAATRQLQRAYQMIEASKYIGRLRLTMTMAVSALDRANVFIHKRLYQRPLCQKRRGNRKFAVVHNVFRLFYIGDIQPILARLHQQGLQLFQSIDQLQAAALPNRHFTAFWDRVYRWQDSEWQRFDRAIAAHTQAWQHLLRQCGHLPG